MVDSSGTVLYSPVEYVNYFKQAKKQNKEHYPIKWFNDFCSNFTVTDGSLSFRSKLMSAKPIAKAYGVPSNVVGVTAIRRIADVALVNAGFKDLVCYCRDMGLATIEARRDEYEQELIGCYSPNNSLDELNILTEFYIDLGHDDMIDRKDYEYDNMADNDDNMSTYCNTD